MMAALFAFFLVAMLLAVSGKRVGSVVSVGIALLLCGFWLLHHSTDKLLIQL